MKRSRKVSGLKVTPRMARTIIGDILGRLISEVLVRDVARLPDGSGCAVGTMPLPKNHWIYTHPVKVPRKFINLGPHVRALITSRLYTASKYAVCATTNRGKEMNFDPDAMVQNFVLGFFGNTLLSEFNKGEKDEHRTGKK